MKPRVIHSDLLDELLGPVDPVALAETARKMKQEIMNWTNYPNFKAEEFRCKHTGKDGMHPDFMQRLQALRNEYGKGMKVTSGYRDKTHPIEARKQTTGAHTTGRAVDIAVEGADALRLVALALKHGFTGIGVQQKGSGRFIHLDDISGNPSQPRPHIWSY